MGWASAVQKQTFSITWDWKACNFNSFYSTRTGIPRKRNRRPAGRRGPPGPHSLLCHFIKRFNQRDWIRLEALISHAISVSDEEMINLEMDCNKNSCNDHRKQGFDRVESRIAKVMWLRKTVAHPQCCSGNLSILIRWLLMAARQTLKFVLARSKTIMIQRWKWMMMAFKGRSWYRGVRNWRAS